MIRRPFRHVAVASLVILTSIVSIVLPVSRPAAQARGASRASLIANGQKCPASEFTCITVKAPLDHFGPSPYTKEMIEVVFGILPARNPAMRKGMLVTAVGGPGGSGLQAADSYAATFDKSIREVFDLVFFDQRGVGLSGGFDCSEAVAKYYQTDGRARTVEQEEAIVNAASTFASECLKKLPSPQRLKFYGTRQAVEDLEVFRKLIGDDLIWLYGESYGTQFAQWYAAAHHDRVRNLILDGAVDLTLSGPEYLRDATQAFNNVLVTTLKACNATRPCRRDMGGDAVKVYDQLTRRLDQAPAQFKFPLPGVPNGKTVERALTLSDLETAVAGFLYSEGERMLLQRALASAANDDLAPLARLSYSALGLDPVTLKPIPDPSYSDAAYYVVTCNDYDYFASAGTPGARAQAYLRFGDAIDKKVPRMNSALYGDLPCVFWPRGDAPPKYNPGFSTLLPTLILGATADPATPVGQGRAIFDRVSNAYLITTQGGAHVTFNRGNACPDDLVTRLLVKGKLPTQAETRCDGVIATIYTPIAPADARAFDDALEAMRSAENEILYSPEYYYWDQQRETSVGCVHGGSFSFVLAPQREDETRFTLINCAFSEGFALTGEGRYDAQQDRFTLSVNVKGNQSGKLDYLREGSSYQVTGTLDGKPVKLTQG